MDSPPDRSFAATPSQRAAPHWRQLVRGQGPHQVGRGRRTRLSQRRVSAPLRQQVSAYGLRPAIRPQPWSAASVGVAACRPCDANTLYSTGYFHNKRTQAFATGQTARVRGEGPKGCKGPQRLCGIRRTQQGQETAGRVRVGVVGVDGVRNRVHIRCAGRLRSLQSGR